MSIHWEPSYDAALTKARVANKLTLLQFHSPH